MTPSAITLGSSTTPAGDVVVSELVIAKLAGQAARLTYGIVAMRRSPRRKIAQMLRGSMAEGIQVDIAPAGAKITLHVIMERGVNLAQVTANLKEQVRYEVGDLGGVPVTEVVVRVEDLHE